MRRRRKSTGTVHTKKTVERFGIVKKLKINMPFKQYFIYSLSNSLSGSVSSSLFTAFQIIFQTIPFKSS